MVKSNLASALCDPVQADTDVELLLPWYATGALGAADARRVSAASVSSKRLVQDVATIRQEQAVVVEMAERLGAPSLRPMLALFAAIDADLANPAKIVAFKAAGATRYAAQPKFRA